MTNIGSFNPAFITLKVVDRENYDKAPHEVIIRTEDIKQIGACDIGHGIHSAILHVNRGKGDDVQETAYLSDTMSDLANKLNICA